MFPDTQSYGLVSITPGLIRAEQNRNVQFRKWNSHRATHGDRLFCNVFPLNTVLKTCLGTSQWIRIHPPRQRTWVRSRLGKCHCNGVTKPVRCKYWAHALEPVLRDKGSHCSEKPEHRNWRVAPARRNDRKPSRSNKADPEQLKRK